MRAVRGLSQPEGLAGGWSRPLLLLFSSLGGTETLSSSFLHQSHSLPRAGKGISDKDSLLDQTLASTLAYKDLNKTLTARSRISWLALALKCLPGKTQGYQKNLLFVQPTPEDRAVAPSLLGRGGT